MLLEVATTRYGSWRLVVACGAHVCLKIPPKGPHTAPYCSKAAQELQSMPWHIQQNSLQRPCHMVLGGLDNSTWVVETCIGMWYPYMLESPITVN